MSDSVFKALASAVRRRILFHLKDGELAAGEIASRFDLAAPTVSRHLGVLKGARLVTERRDGNRILYESEQERLADTLVRFVEEVRPSRSGGTRRGRP